MDRVDALVIGAGVVGLAVGRALARAGLETVVVEAAGAAGQGISSRNSEVVHAGLYYAPGSLKARLCVRGKALLYAYCTRQGVPHAACGKLVVATAAGQHGALETLHRTAHANGVPTQLLDSAAARAMEPALHCTAALWSPSTGIVDSHALMLALQGDLERAGGTLAVHSRVVGGEVGPGRRGGPMRLRVATDGTSEAAREANGDGKGGCSGSGNGHGGDGGVGGRVGSGGGPDARDVHKHGDGESHVGEVDAKGDAAGAAFEIAADRVVNAAGLHACSVARSLHGLDPAVVPRERFAKGSYFALPGRPPFSRLVYPAPVDAWLGVHLTLDLAGQARFGPDVEWLDAASPAAIDYRVDPQRAAAFEAAIRRYWPGLPDGALQPAYSGVRPKIHGPGEPAPDFHIDGPAVHGVAGLVNLFGIESPGLTSALAIGEHVAALLAPGGPAG